MQSKINQRIKSNGILDSIWSNGVVPLRTKNIWGYILFKYLSKLGQGQNTFQKLAFLLNRRIRSDGKLCGN